MGFLSFYTSSFGRRNSHYGVIYLQDKIILNLVPETFFSQEGKTFLVYIYIFIKRAEPKSLTSVATVSKVYSNI